MGVYKTVPRVGTVDEMPWVTVLSVTPSPTLTGAGFRRLGEAVQFAVGRRPGPVRVVSVPPDLILESGPDFGLRR